MIAATHQREGMLYRCRTTWGRWLWFLSLLLPLSARPADRAPLVVVSDDNYPPYIFRDANGRLKGILPDQWALWERKTGVRVDLQAMDWSKAQRRMRDGQADVIDTIFLTAERAKLYDFTPPYAKIEVPVFAHKTLGGLVDVSSLKGFTIGVKAGDAVVEHLAGHNIDSLKEYPSYEAIIQAARNQELKVFSVDLPAAIYFLNKYGMADEFRQSFVIYTGEFHRAVQKNRTDILNLVEAGFNQITSREYRAIDNKWMGTPFLWRNVVRQWGPYLLLGLCAIVLLLAGNTALGYSVRTKTAKLRNALVHLRQSEARIQGLLKVAPVGLGVCRERKFEQVNEMLCRMSGYAREELVNQSTAILYESREEFERAGCLFYGPPLPQELGFLETRMRHKDGRPMIWWLCETPINTNQPDEGFIFSAMDITDRKNMEDALRESRLRLATLSDNLPGGMVYQIDSGVNNSQRQLLYVSAGVERLHDLKPEDVLRDASTIYSQVSKEDRQALAEKEAAAAATLAPFTMEARMRMPSGKIRWSLFCSAPRLLPNGHTVWDGIELDITEQKRVEEERKRLQAQLIRAQQLESIGRLAGGVAHDFNNMLQTILGNVDLVLERMKPSDPGNTELLEIRKAAAHSASLTQQLLAYARKQTVVPQVVDVNHTIEGMINILRRLIGENIVLAWLPAPDLWPIKMDPSQLNQVLTNLCVNARDAIDGVGQVIISTHNTTFGPDSSPVQRGEKPGDYVSILVGDNGCGMDEETLSRVFEPFFTTKKLGHGTGLGLATVYGIVKQNAGFVEVESSPQQGSLFKVHLPRHREQGVRPESRKPVEIAKPAAETLMLVEDDLGILTITRLMLEQMGYRVLAASSPSEALRMAGQHAGEIHLLITDVIMPEMSGRDLADRLKAMHPRLALLFMSGYTADMIGHRGVLADGVRFLQKPFSKDDLSIALRRALRDQG